jgi:hypothetical protein
VSLEEKRPIRIEDPLRIPRIRLGAPEKRGAPSPPPFREIESVAVGLKRLACRLERGGRDEDVEIVQDSLLQPAVECGRERKAFHHEYSDPSIAEQADDPIQLGEDPIVSLAILRGG